MRHLLILSLIFAGALAAAAVYVPDILEDTPNPGAELTVADLEKRANSLEKRIEAMEVTADRYAEWKTCVSLVPVNEVGDEDNRFGYNYDERDGTQADLHVRPGRRPGGREA